MHIKENFDLKNFNTFHVSAHARFFLQIFSLEQLQEAHAWARTQNLPVLLIGQGSNILLKQDFPGLVMELSIKGISVIATTSEHIDIRVMCGEIWHEVVCWSLDRNYYGLENLSLIPGTVGAAPIQNIGAYGVEIKDTLLELNALEISTGKLVTFSNTQCMFSYRNSIFKNEYRDQYIICSISLRLSLSAQCNINYPALREAFKDVPASSITPALVSAQVCKIRSSKLPDHATLGNAGSFFWNPLIGLQQFNELRQQFPDIVGYHDGDQVKLAAAWLIEQAGWKGYREGDVGVHTNHALVLVNYGGASGADLVALSKKIQATVLVKFGVQLWPEVRII